VTLFANSAACALFEMTSVTMRQRRVPAESPGRITGWNGTVMGGGDALGALVGGALAAVGGIRAAMFGRPARRCDSNPARMAASSTVARPGWRPDDP
jgi:hypothetical protein